MAHPQLAQLASRRDFFELQALVDSLLEIHTRSLAAEDKQRVSLAVSAVLAAMRQCLRFEEDEGVDARGAPADELIEENADSDAELEQLQRRAQELADGLGHLRTDVPARLRKLRSSRAHAAAADAAPATCAAEAYAASEPDALADLQLRAMDGMREVAQLTLSERLSAVQMDVPKAVAQLKAFVDVLQADTQSKLRSRKSMLPELTPPRGVGGVGREGLGVYEV